MTRHASFAPVVDAGTRVVVLGSLPGVKSLAAGEYYANPRNAFWRLIGRVIDVDLVAQPYPDRVAALLAAGVGVWDVVATARRVGSLDGAIREVEGNDLAALIARLPVLRLVAFNGQKAGAIGARLLDPATLRLVLPSSSPAHTLPFAVKALAWGGLRPYLRLEE